MSDPGARVVELIYENLQVDEQWSLREDRGFCWWGQNFAQRVWSEPGYDDDGIVIYRLHAQTDVVRGVDVTPSVLQGLNALNMLTVLSALIAVPEQGKVLYRASMWVHDQSVDWVVPIFQLAVAIQAAHANTQGELLASIIGGEPDRSAHPESGERPAMDDMLLINEQLVAPAGEASSRWAGPEMAEFTDRWAGRFVVLASGDETGLTEEFPFLDSTSLLQVTTDQPHPSLGNGMLLRLSIPEHVSDSDGPAWANRMNLGELASLTRTNLLGSWTVVNNTPTFVAFYPNAAHVREGVLTNIVMNAGSRARWIAADYGDDWERPGRIEGARQRKTAQLEQFGSRLGFEDKASLLSRGLVRIPTGKGDLCESTASLPRFARCSLRQSVCVTALIQALRRPD